MSLLIALVIGVAVGASAGFLLREDADLLFMNILVGVVGSITGLAFNFFVLSAYATDALFSWPAILCSIIGASCSVLLFDVLHTLVPKRAAHNNTTEEAPIKED